ncbi:uncharacterized protein [Branchiostoma lanceolatum]|uniref:uncharacterized protein n=1 Tax=Branchiostoma lanceolatum TaxID=7740 RepID=UPI003453EDDD
MGSVWAKEAEKKPLDLTVIDDPQDKNFGNYDLPFENLVIEGGGARGFAYIGALRVLESAGILKNIKRIGGVSAGSMIATYVALGLGPAEVAEVTNTDMSKVVAEGGYLKALMKPFNLYWRYGWETGNSFSIWFGDIVERFTRKGDQPGNPDITFKQLYEMTGKELCVVVSNLSDMTEEYCHVKTTPNLPIRKAVRMSMSIPGLFQPEQSDHFGDNKDFYVDGAVVCNYPLHCFDGWWLSMDEENSFFNRMDDLLNLSDTMHRSNRFEPANPKTVGLMLYYDGEPFQKTFLEWLTKEEREYTMNRPNTALARAYKDKVKLETVEAMEHRKKMHSLIAKFLQTLKKNQIDDLTTISREELYQVFEELKDDFMSLTEEERKALIGEAETPDQLFDEIDVDSDGLLTYDEVHQFFTNRGLGWLTGHKKAHITSLTGYAMKYQELLVLLGKRVYRKAGDVYRSIGVNGDYVNVTDFQLEEADRLYLFKQGAAGVRAFLRTYIANNKLSAVSAGDQL